MVRIGCARSAEKSICNRTSGACIIRQVFVNTKINHLAVWILIIVYQLVGWGWYTIFGEKWFNLHARTMTDIEHTHSVGAYVFAILTAIAVNYTLAVLIARTAPTRIWCGLKVALACWFAFRVRGTRDHLCVLLLRNESMAAHLHRYGPATA